MEYRKSKNMRPYVAVLGGSPSGPKINQIGELIKKVDTLVIGGGLAHTFLKANGGNIGRSLYDPEMVGAAASLIEEARRRNVKLLLPIDTYAANEISPDVTPSLEGALGMFDDKIGMDIGPRTAELFSNAVLTAGTLVWSGPMGMCEFPVFSSGTKTVATAVARTHAYTIVCGKSTLEALSSFSLSGRVDETHPNSDGLAGYFSD